MPELGSRGSELWLALGQASESSPAGVLAVEACRAADRLDQLNDIIAGKGVLQILHFRGMFEDDDERDLKMTVDQVLIEARLQAAGLKALLESPLLLKKAEAKGAPRVDDVAAKRTARRAAAAGS